MAAVPVMYIVAGPPGGGKSSVFPLSRYAGHAFNADDRAADLNRGSYQAIATSIRSEVNREFENFVLTNIRNGASFALETTLRTPITFEQAKLARSNGFRVIMFYVALASVEHHIERVIRRAAARGGHSASEATLRRIHASSLANLRTAVIPDQSGIEILQIYDNTEVECPPKLVLEFSRGHIVHRADTIPAWVRTALGWI